MRMEHNFSDKGNVSPHISHHAVTVPQSLSAVPCGCPVPSPYLSHPLSLAFRTGGRQDGGRASLVGPGRVLGPLQLHLEPLHAHLEAVHRLNGRLSRRRVVETHEPCRHRTDLVGTTKVVSTPGCRKSRILPTWKTTPTSVRYWREASTTG